MFAHVKSKPSPFITYPEVVKELQISRYRVTKLAIMGWLTPVDRPACKITYFRREQVEEVKSKLKAVEG